MYALRCQNAFWQRTASHFPKENVQHQENLAFVHFVLQNVSKSLGSMPEWLKGADCKSAGLAYAGSNPARPNFLNKFKFLHFVKPVLFSFLLRKTFIGGNTTLCEARKEKKGFFTLLNKFHFGLYKNVHCFLPNKKQSQQNINKKILRFS